MATLATRPTDLLRIADLTAEQLAQLLGLAAAMKRHPHRWRAAIADETLACYFEKPSTRTRVSFEAAAYRLGMLPLALRPDELQLGRGEPIADTGRVLSSYVAAIAVRTFAQRTIEELAAAADVPVINALTDEHHPCQALADLLTLREVFGPLDGRQLAFVGDARNNVATSLIEASVLAGVEVVVACPPGYEPVAAGARVVRAPREAVAGADAVYTDVWTSMGEEGEHDRRLAELRSFQVDAELMAWARPHAVFLHCLPAHRGEEVAAAVIDGPQSAVWQQAANRLPTEQAVLYTLITGDWGGGDD